MKRGGGGCPSRMLSTFFAPEDTGDKAAVTADDLIREWEAETAAAYAKKAVGDEAARKAQQVAELKEWARKVLAGRPPKCPAGPKRDVRMGIAMKGGRKTHRRRTKI